MKLYACARSRVNSLLQRLGRLSFISLRPRPVSKSTKGTYRLRRYLWRSCLTFVGPWLVFGLYAYIGLGYLIRPPSNGILPTTEITGSRWVYYVWFVVAVLALDWSRTGLANIEAAALMHPQLAPVSAIGLMWHTDSKWANPLWWLRAINATVHVVLHRRHPSPHRAHSNPTTFWAFLALTTSLIYVALPLSGLTVELSDVSVSSRETAQLFGPSAATFNFVSRLGTPDRVRNRWPLGLETIPPRGSLLYAPDTISGVNSTYFDDLALRHADHIEFFTGPTVHEPVTGIAWGMYSNISCKPIASSQLRMMRVNATGYSIRECPDPDTAADLTCENSWQSSIAWASDSGLNLPTATFPVQLHERGDAGNGVTFDYLAAVDGYTWVYQNRTSPYLRDSNHDDMTFDAIEGRRPDADVTTAMFEIYFVETSTGDDEFLTSLVHEASSGLVDIWHDTVPRKGQFLNATSAGMALHCDITTAVGNAALDPAHRTFSSFKRAKSAAGTGTFGLTGRILFNQLPPQVLALIAMGSADQYGFPVEWSGNEGSPLWNNLHTAAGALEPSGEPTNDSLGGPLPYKALTPENLQLAIYKLLGESVIATMDEGGINPWAGELYRLKPASYLVPGIVSWKYVLALLGLWASILSAGAVWTTFWAGPRWTASPDGFEMFKFGAQYPDTVDRLDAVEFQGCNSAMRQAPGMVGMLPGRGGAMNPHSKLGFIGLSENVAGRDATYTFDRGQAAVTRPF